MLEAEFQEEDIIDTVKAEPVLNPDKIGFADTTPSTIITMDNELSQTRFYCPDCYFGGH